MNKEKINNEVNIAIPYFIFYQAIAIIVLTISNIINFFAVEALLSYLLSFVSAVILIKSGIELRKQKRFGITLLCIYLVLLFIFPIIRPIYVDSFQYMGDIIFFIIAILLLSISWEKWGVKPINK